MLSSTFATAQTHAPIVTMSVTLPDGRTREVTAPEGGVVTIQLKDGTEYSFRPTIHDSSPWNHVVITLFKTATATAATTVLGQVELKRGGPAVDSETTPSFKVSVDSVAAGNTDRVIGKTECSVMVLRCRRLV